jgi:hypothetical protein
MIFFLQKQTAEVLFPEGVENKPWKSDWWCLSILNWPTNNTFILARFLKSFFLQVDNYCGKKYILEWSLFQRRRTYGECAFCVCKFARVHYLTCMTFNSLSRTKTTILVWPELSPLSFSYRIFSCSPTRPIVMYTFFQFYRGVCGNNV